MGRLILKKYFNEKTLYIVTHKRILIIIFLNHDKFIEHYIDQIANINISISKNEIGAITFGESNFYINFIAIHLWCC